MKNNKPKILVLDIETAPVLGYVWQLWENNLGLNQIKHDWFLLSFAAKWLGDPPGKVIYMDQSKAKDVENDRKLLDKLWELLDSCDIVLTQNGKKFDIKKIQARFLLNGMKPTSSFRQLDTLVIAKKHFALTSNKLEYMTSKLCTKYKKLSHKLYPGFELWSQCLKGNQSAWKEMKKYNIHDILSLEELYTKLSPWDNSINFNIYNESESHMCTCGSEDFKRNGYAYTSTGKFQRHKCLECGSEVRDRKNLLTKEKKASLKIGTSR